MAVHVKKALEHHTHFQWLGQTLEFSYLVLSLFTRLNSPLIYMSVVYGYVVQVLVSHAIASSLLLYILQIYRGMLHQNALAREYF